MRHYSHMHSFIFQMHGEGFRIRPRSRDRCCDLARRRVIHARCLCSRLCFTFESGHRKSILNFCRPISHVPSSTFEWKDFDLAVCAIEISGTLLSEFLKGVREVPYSIKCESLKSVSSVFQGYKRHPHTKETHEEVTKAIFSSDIESHLSIALKVSLQILKVLIVVSSECVASLMHLIYAFPGFSPKRAS